MKKIVSVILVLFLLSGYAFAAETSDNLPADGMCIYDAYYSSESENPQSEKGEVILAGSVYGRYSILKFDISHFTDKTFGGNLLSLTVRNPHAGAIVSVYSFDENALNIENTFEIVTVANLSKTGKQRCDFVASKYVKSLLEQGKTTACFAIRTDAKVMSVFSSEYPTVSERPSLVCTEGEAYVKGQKDYEYPEITKEELSLYLKDAVKKGHPRLMATKEDFDRVRSLCFGKDEFLTKQYQAIKERASKYVGKTPDSLPADLVNNSYISHGVHSKDIVLDCAFVYLMEGDSSYASRAVAEAMYFASLSTWGTYQYIDNNQLASAVAFCYDWLYDYLSEGERETLKNALRENHLDTILDLFRNPDASKYQTTFYLFYQGASNHTVLDNTSTVMQAIAIAEDDVDYSAEIIEGAFERLETCYDELYPDGAWHEGVGYWGFVGPYIARMFATLDASFDSYLGFENCRAVVNTSDYPVYAQSSQKAVLYCDSGTERNTDYEKYYFGKMTGNKGLMSYSVKNDDISYPLLCLWYDTELDHNASLDLAKDKYFRNIDMAVMRSDFEGNQETFAAMVVAQPGGHNYMAMGTFNFDALGERWISVPGRDSYSLSGYYDSAVQGKRWKYYFSRSEGNNCIVINPSELGGQNIYSEDKIDIFESQEGGSYAIADLTDAYLGQVQSYRRGLGLFEDRRIVVLQDELIMTDPSEMYSFINFVAEDFEITPEKDVIVSKGNKKIYVNIICDQDYDVSIMQSRGLPTSNLLPGERRIRDMKKIAIRFEEISKADIRVEFIPYLFDEEIKDVKSRGYIPLDEWSVSNEECRVPMLSSLSFDSAPYDAFNPYNRVMFVDSLPGSISAGVDESKYAVTVEKNTEKELFKILVTDKTDSSKMNSYIVCTPPKEDEPVVIDTSGHAELGVALVKATTDDGNVPANTIDGDLDTRWSASGEQSLTIELETVSDVYCIAIAFYSGSARKAYFDLEVSEDGRTWTTVSENESSGKTDDFEYFDISKTKVKYIRYKGYGNSTGQWNSISEIKIYKK